MGDISIKQLFEAGFHVAHKTSRWNPKMKPYIFGARNGIHIIDLQQTVTMFKELETVVRDLAASGGHVLFVGTKKQAQDAIREEAERCGMFHVHNRWLGGTLTNFSTIRQSIERLRKIEEMENDPKIVDALTRKKCWGSHARRPSSNNRSAGSRPCVSFPTRFSLLIPSKKRLRLKKLASSVFP